MQLTTEPERRALDQAIAKATRSPRRKASLADAPLVYPGSLPKLPENIYERTTPVRTAFWLCAWLQDQAVAEAFEPIARRGLDRCCGIAETHAWLAARTYLRENGKDALKNLQDTGGMLFAWAGSTYL